MPDKKIIVPAKPFFEAVRQFRDRGKTDNVKPGIQVSVIDANEEEVTKRLTTLMSPARNGRSFNQNELRFGRSTWRPADRPNLPVYALAIWNIFVFPNKPWQIAPLSDGPVRVIKTLYPGEQLVLKPGKVVIDIKDLSDDELQIAWNRLYK